MAPSKALPWDRVLAVSKHLSSPRDIALFWTLVGTGLRVSEVLELTVSSILSTTGLLLDYVESSPVRTSTKMRRRTIPMSKTLAYHLSQLIIRLPNRNPYTYLFLSRKGTNIPITSRQAGRILSKAFRAAGITNGFSPHSLRKTFAQAVYDGTGENIFLAQQALGHVSPASTVYYLDSQRAAVDAAIVAVLDSRIFDAPLSFEEKPAGTMPADPTDPERLTQPRTQDQAL